MSVRDFVLFSAQPDPSLPYQQIFLGFFITTGLLLLVAPRRFARTWWMRNGPLTEEDLRTPWRRANARLAGALMAAMGVYELWTSFFSGRG